jgi:hypothetical protein
MINVQPVKALRAWFTRTTHMFVNNWGPVGGGHVTHATVCGAPFSGKSFYLASAVRGAHMLDTKDTKMFLPVYIEACAHAPRALLQALSRRQGRLCTLDGGITGACFLRCLTHALDTVVTAGYKPLLVMDNVNHADGQYTDAIQQACERRVWPSAMIVCWRQHNVKGVSRLPPSMPDSIADVQAVLEAVHAPVPVEVARLHLCFSGSAAGSVVANACAPALAPQGARDADKLRRAWRVRESGSNGNGIGAGIGITKEEEQVFVHCIERLVAANWGWIDEIVKSPGGAHVDAMCSHPWETCMRGIPWDRASETCIWNLCDAGLLVVSSHARDRHAPVYPARAYMLIKYVMGAAYWEDVVLPDVWAHVHRCQRGV